MNPLFSSDHLLTHSAAHLARQSSETLFQLKASATGQRAAAQAVIEHLDQALAVKYAGRAQALRQAIGKNTGVVHIDDGSVRITAELPQTVDWDQTRLAQRVRRIEANGDDPSQYVEIRYHVPEARWAAWPDVFKNAFLPARALKIGQPSFWLALVKEGGAS